MEATHKEIGVRVLDEDHDELEAIINNLNAVLKNKSFDMGEIEGAFLDLHNHIRDHFKREEAWMTKAGYPGIKSHISQHKKILEGLEIAIMQFGEQPSQDKGIEAMGFATDFLVDHTVNADQILGGFLDYSNRKLGSYH